MAADEKSGGMTWLHVGMYTNGKPSITAFTVDQRTGSLKEVGEPVPVPMPVCIQWYPAPTIPSAAGQ